MYADKNQHRGQGFTALRYLWGILAWSALALGFIKVLAGSGNHSEVYLILVLLNLTLVFNLFT